MAKLTAKEAIKCKQFYRKVWQGEGYLFLEKYVWNKEAGRYEQHIFHPKNNEWIFVGFPCSKNITQVEWLEELFSKTHSTLVTSIEELSE